MSTCQPSQSEAALPVADACPQHLGNVLRSSRLEQGLSLRALAKRVGLSAHSGVAEYERGTRIPPADLIDAYERALALPSGYLKNLRQQILRERARPRNSETIELSPVPDEPAKVSQNYRLAVSVACAIICVSTAVIAAKTWRITSSAPSRCRPVIIKVCVHAGAAGES